MFLFLATVLSRETLQGAHSRGSQLKSTLKTIYEHKIIFFLENSLLMPPHILPCVMRWALTQLESLVPWLCNSTGIIHPDLALLSVTNPMQLQLSFTSKNNYQVK